MHILDIIPHTGDKNLSTDADSSTDTKKILHVRQNLPKKKKKKKLRQFYTLYELKFSNLRPLLFITFPQEFWKSKKFGHWTMGNGGKKMFKRSEQMKKKKSLQKKIAAAVLHPLWAKVLKSEATSLLYFLPRNPNL